MIIAYYADISDSNIFAYTLLVIYFSQLQNDYDYLIDKKTEAR